MQHSKAQPNHKFPTMVESITRIPLHPDFLSHDRPTLAVEKSRKSMESSRHDPTTSAEDLHWELSSSSLPILPEIYPSIGSMLVIRDASVSTIATRISRFLRFNDIQCTFNVHPGRAVCSTSRVPKFYVQLWERRQPGSPGEILVEIQRRRGCSIAMQRIRSAITRAIVSSDYRFHLKPRGIRSIPLSIKRMGDEKRQLKRNMDLNACINLLESSRHDQKHLGMESLSILTDPVKVNPTDAYEISKTLVYRQGKYGKMLQNEVEDFLHLVQEKGFDDTYGDSMCCALEAISNALDLILKHRHNGDHRSLEEQSDPSGLMPIFWTNLSYILMKAANREFGYVHHAMAATKIIHSLELLKSSDGHSKLNQSPIPSVTAFSPETTNAVSIIGLDDEVQLLLASKRANPHFCAR